MGEAAALRVASTSQFLAMAESSKDSQDYPVDPEGLETLLNPKGLHALCFEMLEPHDAPPTLRTRWALDVADSLREAAKGTEYSIWLDIPLESDGFIVFENLKTVSLM